ncbi:MAG: hypothetical protein A2284_11580 [Deltaproteobacteria bacterium RIFOXYA12_FULL_61_11]|nr:MAG: hypothetical protein A2284_11580 [Deltaproteobacteria bacterium RIFOXYA12_FULL_61_11]
MRTVLYLLAALLIGLVALGLVEITLSALVPAWRPTRPERSLWRYDPLLGWSHHPGIHTSIHAPHGRFEVRINQQGLREDDVPLAKNSRRRLLLLGDSFAWGYGVDVRERFSELLERRFPLLEVVNAGACGYGTDQELQYLRERGAVFEPDLVLVLFSPNDLENNLACAQYGWPKPCFVLTDEALVPLNLPVPETSTAAALVRRLMSSTILLGRLAGFLDLGALMFHDHEPEEHRRFLESLTLPRSLDLQWRLLRELERTSRGMGATFLLVTTPLDQGIQRYFATRATDAGLRYLPLAPPLCRSLAGDAFEGLDDLQVVQRCYSQHLLETTSLPNDPHWNATGHALVAAILGDWLVGEDIFKDTP